MSSPHLSRPSTRAAGLALALLAAPALAACSSAAGAAPAADARPVEGGTVVHAHQQEPACVFGGWIEQAYLSYQVLDNLLSLDEDGTAVPWLAQEWSVSDDGLRWTFRLKEGVEFTDGTPLDAEAVATNVRYWLDGGNSTASVWLTGYVTEAVAVDATTLELVLAKPYPRLAETLTQSYFGIQSPTALRERTQEENCEAPVGSGAFEVQEWNRGRNIVLVRNEGYTSWPANAGHEGPALVETVDWRFVPDPTTRVSALRSGEVQSVYDVPAQQWAPLADEGFTELEHLTKGRPQQISFTTSTGPFADTAVRQAFALSLDRERLVETIGRGLIPYEGNGPVSSSTPGWSEEAAGRWSYDPEEAARLLEEAGWSEVDEDGYRTKDGERLHVVLPYGAGSIINADGSAILQGVQEQARATGFEVELVPVPQAQFFAGAYSKPEERDLQVGYWTAVTAGILHVNWRPSTPEAPNYANAAFYDDPELGALIERGNSAATVEEQEELYRQAQELIADEALSIGLYGRMSTLAVSPGLRGVWQEHAQGGPVFHDAYLVD